MRPWCKGCCELAPEATSMAALGSHQHGQDHEMQTGQYLRHTFEIAAQAPGQAKLRLTTPRRSSFRSELLLIGVVEITVRANFLPADQVMVR